MDLWNLTKMENYNSTNQKLEIQIGSAILSERMLILQVGWHLSETVTSQGTPRVILILKDLRQCDLIWEDAKITAVNRMRCKCLLEVIRC